MGNRITCGHLFVCASLALAVSCLLLTGCSKSNTPKNPTPSVPVEFHIDWAPGPDYSGFYVAEQRGYYNEAKVKVTIIPGNGAESAAKALQVGAVVAGTTTVDALLNLARHTAPEGRATLPKIAAVIFTKNPVVVVTQKGVIINSPSDFFGKKIAFTEESSVTYRQFKDLIFRKLGISPTIILDPNSVPKKVLSNQIVLVMVGYDEARFVEAGLVDGALAYTTDLPVALEAEHYQFNVKYLEDLGVRVAGMVVAVSADHRKRGLSDSAVTALVDAIAKGWDNVHRDQNAATSIMMARFPEFKESQMRLGISKSADLLSKNGGVTAPTEMLQILKASDIVVAGMLGQPNTIDLRDLVFSPAQKP